MRITLESLLHSYGSEGLALTIQLGHWHADTRPGPGRPPPPPTAAPFVAKRCCLMAQRQAHGHGLVGPSRYFQDNRDTDSAAGTKI